MNALLARTTPAPAAKRAAGAPAPDAPAADRSAAAPPGPDPGLLERRPTGDRPVAHEAVPAGEVDRPSVIVVDDHALVAHGVVLALSAAGIVARACLPADGADVLGDVARYRPTVVLLDLILAGAPVSSLDLVGPLRGLGCEVVAFSGTTDPVLLAAALEAGVLGVISKADPIEELVDGVRRAAQHESLVKVQRREALFDQLRRQRAEDRARLAPFQQLTPREAAVLERLMDGESAESIAAASYVSLATVRTQIRAILTKLGVNSQLAAVAMAYRAGWTFSRPSPAIAH
jgi:DNA-binding NarL/FixJ family response regulator